jgi:glycosyltransferase involved in cell wall biosynthesis
MPGVSITRCGGALKPLLPAGPLALGPSWPKALLDVALCLRLAARLIRNKARRRGYDCIHAVDELAFGCWLLRPLLGTPVIYDMDSSIAEQFAGKPGLRRISWLGRWLEERCVSVATAVLVVAPELARRVVDIEPRRAVFVLPDRPPVTAAMIDAARKEPSPLAEGLPRPLLLYVGNLGSHQGVAELLAAFELERRAGLRGSLAIAGRPAPSATTRDTPAAGVVFLGEVSPETLAAVYSRVDVLVSPRLRGSNPPMKVYEYLETGRLVLATRIEGHSLLEGVERVVWADPDVAGLRSGLRAAVAAWQRGDVARPRRRTQPAEDLGEGALERAYAMVADAGAASSGEGGSR